jgi:hypothetical protein
MMSCMEPRNWKTLTRDDKYYVMHEKWNPKDEKDSENGLYLYSCPKDDFDFDKIANPTECQKVKTTQYPIILLDFESLDETVGVAWVEQHSPHKFVINLAETFYGGTGGFVICDNPTILDPAFSISNFNLDIVKNGTTGKYEYLIYYNWKETEDGPDLGGCRRHC